MGWPELAMGINLTLTVLILSLSYVASFLSLHHFTRVHKFQPLRNFSPLSPRQLPVRSQSSPKLSISLSCSASSTDVPPPDNFVVASENIEVALEAKDDGDNINFSRKAILAFVLTTVAIWLSDPILSLIDTSVVGRSSPLSLAAMGPATMLIDSRWGMERRTAGAKRQKHTY